MTWHASFLPAGDPGTGNPRQSTTSGSHDKDKIPPLSLYSLSAGGMFLERGAGRSEPISDTGILGRKVWQPQALRVGLERLEILPALESERKGSEAQLCYLPAV